MRASAASFGIEGTTRGRSASFAAHASSANAIRKPRGRRDISDLEADVRDIARALHRRSAGRRPAIFQPRDWLRRLIEQSLGDDEIRTALFRFVDVLPSLGGARDVGAHLEEYFGRVDHALGGLTLLAHTLHAGWLVAPFVRHNVVSLARRFIVEEDAATLAGVLEGLRREPAAFTLDVVGEATASEIEARAMLDRYRRLLRELAGRAREWPEVPAIDVGPRGPLARVNLSVKPSALYARFDPLDPETARAVSERLRELCREAASLGASITVDMEQRQFKDTTLAVFRSLLEDDALASEPPIGIALQAYLPETEADLPALVECARERRRRIAVRLVKGAYWDSEVAWAEQKGWPIPVFTEKPATDEAYERLTRVLLESTDVVDACFGSHNLRTIAHALAVARRRGLASGAYEIQMLYGMAEPLRQALIESGERVRVYLPVGELIPGMAYLIRRLLENTSNVSFLRESYVEERDLERLLEPPSGRSAARSESLRAGAAREGPGSGEFRNEPPTNFAHEPNRARFRAGLRRARAAFGSVHPVYVGAEAIETGAEFASTNPADTAEIVGRVALANERLVDRAVAAADEAFATWRRTPVETRAAVLLRAADEMRGRRAELAAKIILEVGKGWRDADAEVSEAIDYLEYYGREAMKLGVPRSTQRLRAETNQLRYDPRGVAAVIAPWNFPLAIALGMTAAALVTGNTVVLKPAEQSPVIGAELIAILRRAGLPPAAASLLHGPGSVGAALAGHHGVAAIAFTGSRAVGLEILSRAAASPTRGHSLKRVICEMGGKNAIVVDRDADQDEALFAILESAFGYQGQKCSAASRVILVGDSARTLVPRLVEATRTLRVGPPEDPRHFIGPLIDEEAKERVRAAIERARTDGRLLLGPDARPPPPERGHFVAPAIVAEIDPKHPLAQEEIFGPLLCVFATETFEEAIALANATPYGLTGGVFSRSPAHLEYARRELRVGNLYVNRSTTGAVVGRQPFGGVKLSGVGWKAGGPDYLGQFVESRTISENTLRHGFVPD